MARQSRSRPRHRLAWGGRPRSLLDDLELLAARLFRRDLRLWEAIVLRLSLLAIVAVLLIQFAVPASSWFGHWIGDQMAQQMRQSLASPTPGR